MAKLEAELKGNFEVILQEINNAILVNSSTASLEDKSFFKTENSRCAVHVYERYSFAGKNRVSMSVTLLEADGRLFASAITSGGSQAMIFKINTVGEKSFLDLVKSVFTKYRA